MAFLAPDAERVKSDDLEAARALEYRALRLCLRARDYGLTGLELRHPGIGDRLRRRPEDAVDRLGAADLEMLFATASAWGGTISLGLDRPEVVADLPAVRALLGRALELDEDFGEGTLHEALLVLSSLPPEMGGSLDTARFHYRRAVTLSRGLRASPHVLYAARIAVPAKDRPGFEEKLALALAIDVDEAKQYRLQNILNQRRARRLLADVDDYFFEEVP
jgi:hypothetical protein